MKKAFYITTTLPYVNADLHLGHAMELIRADALARAKTIEGYDVFFNTGTDEHGMKIYEAAAKAGKTPQEYTDYFALRFKEGLEKFGIMPEAHLIRTTDLHHIKAAQEFWKLCADNGFIYKKNYKIKYCVGCEEEKSDSELQNGKCPIHLNRDLELIDEENYFFKYSAFGEKLLAFYNENRSFVVPEFRLNEIKEFIKKGLEDFSISRLASKMSWGIPVPGDSEQVMYVWFDALVNYISTLGWPEDKDTFTKFWANGTPVQICGKDNTRFQAAMWQAMLMAAGISNTHTLIVNGHVTGEGGIKMSKSLGNVVNPYDIVDEYGTDALRYFCLAELSAFEDSPFTMERFKESYNAKLANGIGNLTSRIMKMAETNLSEPVGIEDNTIPEEYFKFFKEFELNRAMDFVWSKIGELDTIIQQTEPFKLVKVDKEKGTEIIIDLVKKLYIIAGMLNPFMTDTSEKIKACIKANKSPETPLFLRK